MESFEPPLDALDAVVEMGEHRSGLVDARHPGAACCERVGKPPDAAAEVQDGRWSGDRVEDGGELRLRWQPQVDGDR